MSEFKLQVTGFDGALVALNGEYRQLPEEHHGRAQFIKIHAEDSGGVFFFYFFFLRIV